MVRIPGWVQKYVVDCSIKPTDSAAKARAIRISNVITISAILNSLGFTAIFYVAEQTDLFAYGLFAAFLYTLGHLTSIFVNSLLGRTVVLLMGYSIVFYFSCVFRGLAGIQFCFFSLGVATFLHFSWEERKFYKLAIIPLVLYMTGEFYNWNFFTHFNLNFDMHIVRTFAVFATMYQVIFSTYFFVKQSVRFEAESLSVLAQLEIEHKKQLHVQKMSSLGEMAAGISHEINNPLMVIIGSTFYLKKEIPEDHPLHKRIVKIDQMISRISRIIHALKNFSRNSEKDSMEVVAIQSIVETTLDLCRERFINANIELLVEVQENLFVNCRPTEISQVLINLLNNSFDACCGRENSRVSIKAKKHSQKIEILVQDTGPGIAAENEVKLMQPFFTTKEVGKGTGLGLSISRGLIEGHAGTLNYVKDSPLTTFQILLPFVEC